MSHKVYIRSGTCILACIASSMNVTIFHTSQIKCDVTQEHYVMCYGSKLLNITL